MNSPLPLVIYHANCADGFGAAFAAYTKLKDHAVYVAASYSNTKYEAKTGYLTVGEIRYSTKGRRLYILDFSFSRSVMDELFTGCSSVIWLDHHKTAIELHNGAYDFNNRGRGNEHAIIVSGAHTGEIVLDDSRSGALIAWEYFHKGESIPMWVKYIDDGDRWQFKIDGTKEFSKALWSYAPWSFNQWENMFMNPIMDYEPLLVSEGEAILRAHEQQVEAVIAATKRPIILKWFESTPIDNPHVPSHLLSHYQQYSSQTVIVEGIAANCPKHLASNVGHRLATESQTFGLAWFMDSKGEIECSLRSNGDFDVSTIAKKFGGGGHKNASGMNVQVETLISWLQF